jgi:molybdopterin/thiamine biosynthesis adenylyltransferase
MNSIQLKNLSRQINKREENIQELRKRTSDNCNATICEVIQQGHDLIQAKASLSHGQFADWLSAHCPSISHRTANLYMRVASNAQRIKNLTEAGSLRAALLLCDDEPATGNAEPRSLLPYLEAISRASKFLSFVTDHPLSQWPSEGLDKLRQDMQPIAAQLWPDRFA